MRPWIVALAVLLALPSTALAGENSRKKAIWGPVELQGVSQFPIYDELGVGIFQMRVSWSSVATARPANPRDPADPAYAWPAEVDRALELARPYGIRLSILLMDTPAWANGGRDPRWAPTDPRDFADFAAAASRRWRDVGHWMIWSEPTKPSNWQPLVGDRRRPLRGRGLDAPRRYARLLDRAYGALKAVDRRDQVIGGNTYTVGAVAPLRWISAMRLPDGRPPRMDLFGHNGFAVRKPDLGDGPLGNGLADFNDLDTVHRAVARNLRRPGRRTPRIFVSEYSLPTGHENFEFNFFMTERTQRSWISAALREVRRAPQVYTLGYLGLYDDALRPDGRQVERGLIRRDGTRKPAFAAFAAG
jgi:hypothetical protein